jgi:hypothetical protein
MTMAQNTAQDDPIATLAGELVLLVAEDSESEDCACGASWDADRAGAVVARLGIRPPGHPTRFTHLSKD